MDKWLKRRESGHFNNSLERIKRNRFVFLTGDFDANREQTIANYKAYLRSGIKNCAYIQVKDMGHAYPPLAYWQVAFSYLDGKDLKNAFKENERIPDQNQ
jgi:hypothetical protein